MRNKRTIDLPIAALILLTLVSSFSYANDASPVSLTLKLSKKVLALAEPTMLTLEITNHSGRDLIIDSRYMFNLFGRSLKFFLIDPKGKISSYQRSIASTPFKNSNNHATLPSETSVTVEHLMWWTPIVAEPYREALEKMPPGSYRLFATYRFPDQEGVEDLTLHSDTFDFVFLPFDENDKLVMDDLNSLSKEFLGLFEPDSKGIMERIANSSTPYSEAAAAMLVSWIWEYDSLERAKAQFDLRYPNSVFSSYLLAFQFFRYRDMLNPITGYHQPTLYLDSKADSLLQVWKSVSPKSLEAAIWRGEIKKIEEEQRGGK